MALARARRRQYAPNYWPGFVDMLSTLLLVVIFLMALFMVTNFIITQASSGKDTMLSRLNRQLSELTELLALERSQKDSAEDSLSALQATLLNKDKETQRLTGLLGDASGQTEGAEERAAALGTKLDDQRKITNDALAKVEDAQAKISDLGQRLNVALAKKVQELARYRSDFFGKLREALGARQDFQIVGDRFVFPSDVLFDPGSADLKPEATFQLDKLANSLKEIEGSIPPDIAWVMRVDGHTDITPIATAEFPSNWELSSARAISVVRYLMSQGIAPEHLVAAGFGEFQPIDAATTDAAMARNRRIELKLTEREPVSHPHPRLSVTASRNANGLDC